MRINKRRTKAPNKFVVISVLSVLLFGGCSEPLTDQLSKKIGFLTSRLESLHKQLIENNPENQKYKIDLASFYYKQREYKKAKDTLKRVSSKKSRLLLAKAYARLSDYTAALDIFERIKDIEDEEALYLYGVCSEAKNLFNKAEEIYSRISSQPYLSLAQQKIASFKNKFQRSVPAYLKKIIADAPSAQDYPNASSVALLYDEKIKVTPDNKSITTIHAVIKVLNNKGRKQWGEVEIGYDSTYETVELDFARTITPDENIVYAAKKNIRDVSKYLNFPLYSNARAFIISMPQVLNSSIIEYKATIYGNKLINTNDFSFIYRLQENFPVLDTEFIVSVPQGRKFDYTIINPEYIPEDISVRPEVTCKRDDTCDFIFRAHNIPQLLSESQMVPASFINPAIALSSFSSWQEYFKWWRALYIDKVKLSEDLNVFLDGLIDKEDSTRRIAEKIYEFCADKIRYVAVEYGQAGFEPHSPEEVFLNKYGDCKDQALLLVSLLRGAGLEAYPVLIPTKEAYDLKERQPASYFNHAIACVKLDGELVFMDPTASTTAFGDLPIQDQNRKVLVFFDEDYKILQTPIIGDNSVKKVMGININEDESAVFNRRIVASGFYAASQRYYLKYTPPYLIKDNLQEEMKKFSSLSKLRDFNMENIDSLNKNPVLSYGFYGTNFLSKVQDLRILPLLTENVVNVSWIDRDNRKYPIDLRSPHFIEYRVDINLPPTLKAEYIPADSRFESKWLDFGLSYQQEDKQIVMVQELNTKIEQVEPQDYREFKSLIEKILYSLKQQIILRKTR